MKTQFTPIAMRFNKENWESIKDKIEAAGIGHNVWAIGSTSCYLANNWQDDNSLFIGNHSFDHSNIELVDKVYETWDEAIFLRACGIEPEVYTVPKEFILEGHKAACSTWKAKIEAQFPELFPKVDLKVNKWYKVKTKGYDKEALICFDNDKLEFNYGFNHIGVFSKNFRNLKECLSDDNQEVEPATDEEVKTALIAEAKKRGYKEGVNIKNLLANSIVNCVGKSFLYQNNELWFSCIGCIFKDGKWAEIIPETVELSLEDIAKKFGVDVSQIKIKS